MGNIPQNKYHINDDGKVYRVNDDGSFTEMGNIEDSLKKKDNNPGSTKLDSGDTPNYPRTNESSSHDTTSKKSVVPFFIMIVIAILGIYIFLNSNSSQTDAYETNITDSIFSAYEVEPVEETDAFIALPEIDTLVAVADPEIQVYDVPVQEAEVQEKNEPEPVKDYKSARSIGEMEGPDNFYILFPDDRTDLNSEHINRIYQLVCNIHNFENKKIIVDGFVQNSIGNMATNAQWCRKRVDNVVNALIDFGIPNNIIFSRCHNIDNDDYGNDYGHVSVMVEENDYFGE